MNTANILTLTRILLMPIYLIVFYSNLENKIIYAGMILILAGITDILDGYIARKYDMVTKLGTALDPVSDKITTFVVLISFVSANIIPIWILIVLGLKEAFLIMGGAILYYHGDKEVIPANKFGKIATTSFYIAVIAAILNFPNTIVYILFYIVVALHLIAFVNYLSIFTRTIKDKNRI